jgi:hypothetical protein
MAVSDESIEASNLLDQVKKQYFWYDHQHAIAVLTLDYPALLKEICEVLLAFKLTLDQVRKAGGNESEIPKSFSNLLRPLGWVERKLEAKLVVDEKTVSSDTHKVDYVKGEVAFDLEWNAKDQTFDRDLYAFRAFFEYRRISVAILITRDETLNAIFKAEGLYQKYGASTTHINKLIPRLQAGRSGGCPVLVFGITPKQIIP